MYPKALTDVANRLVAGCREGRELEGLDLLYAADAVSVEALAMGEGGAESHGRDGIKAKHDWWRGAMDVHAAKVDGPFLHAPDKFSVIFDIDATDRATGERRQMTEVGVYQIRDGKIVREEFHYHA